MAMSAARISASMLAAVIRATGDADRRADVDAVGAQLERLGDGEDDPARDPLDVVGRLDLGEEHRELVAGEAREQRTRAARLPVNSALTTTRSRLATMISSWSPRAWPRLSLTLLKRSRSTNSIAEVATFGASLSNLSASERKWSRLGSEVTGSYMPSAGRSRSRRGPRRTGVSTAVASFGIVRRTTGRRRRDQVAVLDREQPIAERGERAGALAVRAFGRRRS